MTKTNSVILPQPQTFFTCKKKLYEDRLLLLGIHVRNGYADKGTVAKEGNYCTLHLMEKQLR